VTIVPFRVAGLAEGAIERGARKPPSVALLKYTVPVPPEGPERLTLPRCPARWEPHKERSLLHPGPAAWGGHPKYPPLSAPGDSPGNPWTGSSSERDGNCSQPRPDSLADQPQNRGHEPTPAAIRGVYLCRRGIRLELPTGKRGEPKNRAKTQTPTIGPRHRGPSSREQKR